MTHRSGRHRLRRAFLVFSGTFAALAALALPAPGGTPRAALIPPDGYDAARPDVIDGPDRDSLDPSRGRPRSNGNPPPRWLTPSTPPATINAHRESGGTPRPSRPLANRLVENQLAGSRPTGGRPTTAADATIADSATTDSTGAAGTAHVDSLGPASRSAPLPSNAAPDFSNDPRPGASSPTPEEPGLLESTRRTVDRRLDAAVRGEPLPPPADENPTGAQASDSPPPAAILGDGAGPVFDAELPAIGPTAPPFVDSRAPAIGGIDHPRARSKHGLPSGLLYKSYLAGEKEPRFALQHLVEAGRGPIWEVVLGGRVGIYRNGTRGAINPEGFQLDIEGAAMPRLDVDQQQDMDAVDYRFGIPLTWREGPWAYKVAYAHLSSHLGDEFMVKNPEFDRINYVRDALVFGASYDPNEDSRVYGEFSLAWHMSGGAGPLELQAGYEHSPARPGRAMFWAINGHVRQNESVDSSVNLEAGWQWRGADSGHLFRLGGQYYNGKSMQYEFFDKSESLLGVGMWFDY